MADAHAKPQHDYHLVNPSPWPFLGSVGALVMAIGGVCLMQYLKGGDFPIFGGGTGGADGLAGKSPG